MSFSIKTRYGAMERFDDRADIPAIVERLIRELETEQHDGPDDEHTQVAVSNEDWSVTVQVSGLMTLSVMRLIEAMVHDPSIKLPEELPIRAKSRQEVFDSLSMMARGEVEAVRSAPWAPFDQVPPYERDLFRGRTDA
jgi:hypothetical protein